MCPWMGCWFIVGLCVGIWCLLMGSWCSPLAPWLHWGLNQEPCAYQPSYHQTELPLPPPPITCFYNGMFQWRRNKPFSTTCLLILLQVVDVFCSFLIPFCTFGLRKTSRTNDSYLADKEGSNVVSVLKNLSCRPVQYLLKSLNYHSYKCNDWLQDLWSLEHLNRKTCTVYDTTVIVCTYKR